MQSKIKGLPSFIGQLDQNHLKEALKHAASLAMKPNDPKHREGLDGVLLHVTGNTLNVVGTDTITMYCSEIRMDVSHTDLPSLPDTRIVITKACAQRLAKAIKPGRYNVNHAMTIKDDHVAFLFNNGNIEVLEDDDIIGGTYPKYECLLERESGSNTVEVDVQKLLPTMSAFAEAQKCGDFNYGMAVEVSDTSEQVLLKLEGVTSDRELTGWVECLRWPQKPMTFLVRAERLVKALKMCGAGWTALKTADGGFGKLFLCPDVDTTILIQKPDRRDQ